MPQEDFKKMFELSTEFNADADLLKDAKDLDREMEQALPVFNMARSLAKLGSFSLNLIDHSCFKVSLSQIPYVTNVNIKYIRSSGVDEVDMNIHIYDDKAYIRPEAGICNFPEKEFDVSDIEGIRNFVFSWAAEENTGLLLRAEKLIKLKTP